MYAMVSFLAKLYITAVLFPGKIGATVLSLNNRRSENTFGGLNIEISA